jgi:hypothetical protein
MEIIDKTHLQHVCLVKVILLITLFLMPPTKLCLKAFSQDREKTDEIFIFHLLRAIDTNNYQEGNKIEYLKKVINDNNEARIDIRQRLRPFAEETLYLIKATETGICAYFIIDYSNGRSYRLSGFNNNDIIALIDDYRFKESTGLSRMETWDEIKSWILIISLFSEINENSIDIDFDKAIKQSGLKLTNQ